MLEWQSVHSWPFAELPCEGADGLPVVVLSDGKWHCRQIVFTLG